MSDTSTPGRKAGNRGARESHEPRLDVRLFDKGVEGPTYVEWDGSNGQTEWGMDFNGPDPNNPPAYPNGLGCCGWAAPDHGDAAKANDMSLIGTLGADKFPGVRPAAYFAYGVSQGEQGQPPAPPDQPDQGVDNQSWLAFLYKHGVIYGYGEVPVALMDRYAPKAHGLLIGQVPPATAEQDFEASPPVPWGSPGETPGQDGHDTWYVLGHADGSGAMITWGAVQPFTVEYRTGSFITDCWIIYDKDDPTVDHAALQAALAEVHGVVAPTTTDPVPQPPEPLPATHEGWWQGVQAWIKRHV